MFDHRVVAAGALMVGLSAIYNMIRSRRERQAVAAKLAHIERRHTNSF